MCCLYKFTITARFAAKKKNLRKCLLPLHSQDGHTLIIFVFFCIQNSYIVEINGLHDGT